MTTTTTTSVRLPVDLAPALRQDVLALLGQVTTTTAPELVVEASGRPPRCVVCFSPGKLGGHHGPDGLVQWIHRSCHRRLHRSGRHAGHLPPRTSRRTAC